MSQGTNATRTLAEQLAYVKPAKINQLSAIMLNASIVYELGGDYKALFKKARFANLGLLRRIYRQLEEADWETIEEISRIMSDDTTFQREQIPAPVIEKTVVATTPVFSPLSLRARNCMSLTVTA